MINVIRKIYRKVFPDFPIELERITRDCKSLLDVGCGPSSQIKGFSRRMYSVGIDAYGPSIVQSKKQKIHNKYFMMDVLDIGKKFKKKSFDCVLASDIIEHLPKKQGLRLIKDMESIALKKVIITTPNGFMPQGPAYNNPWQVHRSGWSVTEMRKKGYEVAGLGGWKPLRAEGQKIRFRPKYFWILVSDITQIFVRNHPEKACQLLCIKELGKKK